MSEEPTPSFNMVCEWFEKSAKKAESLGKKDSAELWIDGLKHLKYWHTKANKLDEGALAELIADYLGLAKVYPTKDIYKDAAQTVERTINWMVTYGLAQHICQHRADLSINRSILAQLSDIKDCVKTGTKMSVIIRRIDNLIQELKK